MMDDFEEKAKQAVGKGFVEGIVLGVIVCIVFGFFGGVGK